MVLLAQNAILFIALIVRVMLDQSFSDAGGGPGLGHGVMVLWGSKSLLNADAMTGCVF